MIRTVYLHGSLRERFGTRFRLDVETPSEAARALCAQLPGFDMVMRQGQFRVRAHARGERGRFVRQRTVVNDTVNLRLGLLDTIHIFPAAAGAKGGKGGIGKIVLGVVLIATAMFTGGATLGLGATAFAIGSGAGAMTITFGQIAMLGLSMVLAGVSQMLAPSPQVDRYEKMEQAEDRPNFGFQQAVNAVEEGGAIPWIFGKRVRVGSTVISSGIIAEQIGASLTTVAEAEAAGVLDAEADGVTGAKKKKKKKKKPVEEPDSLQSKSLAYILELIGEGQLELCNGLQSVFLDNTPVENEDGTRNFEGFSLEWRSGLPDQKYIPGFADVMENITVGIEATYASPVIQRITTPGANRAIVTIRLPNGLLVQDGSGDLRQWYYDHAIDVRADGGAWQNVVYKSPITGKASPGYEFSYEVELPAGAANWDIRLRRLREDETSATRTSDLMLATITVKRDLKLTYPYCALAGIRVDAQTFGGEIAERSFEVKRVDARIPSNYDPETRTYNGIWDGTWKRGETDNGALAVWDLFTNTLYGSGEETPEWMVDKWAIYAAAQRCDGMVPDGKGGMRPRFTFNGALTTREDAYNVFNALAASFQAMTYWSAGAVMLVQDRPRDPVKIVSPANVIDGAFTYEGTALRARHSQALVTYNEPDNNFKPTPAFWLDVDAQIRFGRRQADVLKWGCTNEDEALAFGRWLIDSEATQDQTVTYKASLEQADLAPGDLIALQDPTIMGARFAGRLDAITTTTATLDQAVDLLPGESYLFAVAGYSDGKPIWRTVTNLSGSTASISFTPDLTGDLPMIGANWAIFSTNLPSRQFQVMGNRQTEKTEFQITAVSYDPDKWDRIEQEFVRPPRPISLFKKGPISAPTGMTVREYMYQAGPLVRSAALLAWNPPSGDPRVIGYELAIKGPGDGDYILQKPQFAPSFTIYDVQPGAWSFQVRSYDDFGQRSEWHTLNVALLSLSMPPSNVGGFRLALQGNQVLGTWPPVNDLDLSHYRIRHTTALVAAKWENALDLVEQATGTQAGMPAIAGTYLIKAVDTQDNESVAAAMAVLDPSMLADVNIVEILQHAPDWDGTLTNLEVVGGVLRLTSDVLADWPTLSEVEPLSFGISGPASSGIYHAGPVFDMGAIYSARISTELSATAENLQDRMANWGTLSEVSTLSGLGADDWSVKLQLRFTNDDPLASPSWTDWQDALVGNYSFRAVDRRLLVNTYRPAAQVYLDSWALTIDMEDRRIKLEDVTCPAGGITIPFDPPFRAVPNVQMTPQDLQTGDKWEISGKSTSSVTIRFWDESLADVERTFDLTVTGYGVEQ
jgi:predicted phage tail protein